MQDLKMSPAQDQPSQACAHREPYAPPTVTVIPLKIEERLLKCLGKGLNTAGCDGNGHGNNNS